MVRPTLLLVFLLVIAKHAAAYSALTHQALVDTCWERALVPTIQARFPGSSVEELRHARAFAYGGALIQDMGFYPFGSALFTNLTHYVRSGDFVRNLLDGAHTRNEYAFALGALSHYVADNFGHPEGTNRVLAEVYPEIDALSRRHAFTYAEAEEQHTCVEFAFDAAQVAAGRYRSEDFHEAIGFRVSRHLLEQAFFNTYGLTLGEVGRHKNLSIAAYRFAATTLIPLALRAQGHLPARVVRRLSHSDRRSYYFTINCPRYRRQGIASREHLGLDVRLAAPLLPLLPRLGLVRSLAYRPLPVRTEILLRASYDTSQLQLMALLDAERTGCCPALPNTNLDTGIVAQPGDYPLTDHTYAMWLTKLTRSGATTPVASSVRNNVLAFYDCMPSARWAVQTQPQLTRLMQRPELFVPVNLTLSTTSR